MLKSNLVLSNIKTIGDAVSILCLCYYSYSYLSNIESPVSNPRLLMTGDLVKTISNSAWLCSCSHLLNNCNFMIIFLHFLQNQKWQWGQGPKPSVKEDLVAMIDKMKFVMLTITKTSTTTMNIWAIMSMEDTLPTLVDRENYQFLSQDQPLPEQSFLFINSFCCKS